MGRIRKGEWEEWGVLFEIVLQGRGQDFLLQQVLLVQEKGNTRIPKILIRQSSGYMVIIETYPKGRQICPSKIR